MYTGGAALLYFCALLRNYGKKNILENSGKHTWITDKVSSRTANNFFLLHCQKEKMLPLQELQGRRQPGWILDVEVVVTSKHHNQ